MSPQRRVSELAQLSRAKYQLCVLKCPTGVYTFVGSGIPQALANNEDGTRRLFPTEDAAWLAAAEFGIVRP